FKTHPMQLSATGQGMLYYPSLTTWSGFHHNNIFSLTTLGKAITEGTATINNGIIPSPYHLIPMQMTQGSVMQASRQIVGIYNLCISYYNRLFPLWFLRKRSISFDNKKVGNQHIYPAGVTISIY